MFDPGKAVKHGDTAKNKDKGINHGEHGERQKM
jgi:hypothetical protein